MANLELLRKRIRDSGMTVTSVTKKAGICRETFYNRLQGRGEFRASEIHALSDVLKLSGKEIDVIFFKTEGELKSQKEEGV